VAQKLVERVNSMNIAHILSHVSNVYAGVPIGTRRMVSALSRLGINVSVWATGNQQEENEFAAEGIIAHLYKAGWPVSWRRSPDLAHALKAKSTNLDIFHIHEVWHYPQLRAVITAKKRGLPYILAPRASLEPWRMMYKGFKKNVYLKLLGGNIVQNAFCLHAVSTAEVDGFRKIGYKGPVFVAHNGIVPEEFEDLPDPAQAETQWPVLKGRRVVLYLSRISPEKGLDELIPAWSAVIKKPSYSDALLVIAGPDDRGYRSKIENMVLRAGLEAHVLLTGMVNGRNKFALISRADLFTLPSYSEGFSNALLENLAAGKPTLITPGCNFPEVVEVGAGICVEPERNSLGEALMQLLDMPREKLTAMGKCGRSLVMKNYTWDIAARKITMIYDLILKGKEIPLYPEPIPIDINGKAILS
jgi:glycosyltransferase involved in cell wall biosynthesis